MLGGLALAGLIMVLIIVASSEKAEGIIEDCN